MPASFASARRRNQETAVERIVHRTCSLCEACCGIEVRVEEGKIAAIRGDACDPLSRGEICAKALSWSLRRADVEHIHRINILQSSLLAMRRAVDHFLRVIDTLAADPQQPVGGFGLRLLQV